MPKPAETPLGQVLANAEQAQSAAEVERVTKDLSAAVAEGVAGKRRSFRGHSQATRERLLTEERAAAETLNELDAKIAALADERADAFEAYSAVKGAREALGGAN